MVQDHLEAKYQKPVLVVANRTIISPGGKYYYLFYRGYSLSFDIET
jgi:hypothetical protein